MLAGEREDFSFGLVHEGPDVGVSGREFGGDLVHCLLIEARSAWANIVRNTAATISLSPLATWAKTCG